MQFTAAVIVIVIVGINIHPHTLLTITHTRHLDVVGAVYPADHCGGRGQAGDPADGHAGHVRQRDHHDPHCTDIRPIHTGQLLPGTRAGVLQYIKIIFSVLCIACVVYSVQCTCSVE